MKGTTERDLTAGNIARISSRKLGAWGGQNVGTAIAVIAIVVVWEGITQLHIQNDAYLPSASFTLSQSAENIPALADAARQTFGAFLVAYPIAVMIGIGVGILFAESFYARQSSMPILIFSYAIPHAILAPMFLIWFGLGFRGTAAFAVWIAFFPTFINTLTSMSTTDREMQKLAGITGATKWQQIRYLKFWRALPDIVSGMRISVQMTIVGVIVAEFLAGGVGLGHLITQSSHGGRIGLTFGAVIVIGVGAIILFNGISWALNFIDPSQRGASEIAGES